MRQFVRIAGTVGAVRHDAFSMAGGYLMSRPENFKLTHYHLRTLPFPNPKKMACSMVGYQEQA